MRAKGKICTRLARQGKKNLQIVLTRTGFPAMIRVVLPSGGYQALAPPWKLIYYFLVSRKRVTDVDAFWGSKMAKKKAAAVANGGLLDDSEASSASESLENPSTAEVSGESVPAHDGATLAAMALPVADRSNAAGDVVADPEPLAVDSSANVIERPPKQVTGRPRNDGQPILPRVVMPGGVKLPARDAAKIVEVLEARGVDRSLIFPGVAATIAQAHGGNGAAIRPGVLGSSVRPASGGPSEVSDDAPAASVSPFARRRVMG